MSSTEKDRAKLTDRPGSYRLADVPRDARVGDAVNPLTLRQRRWIGRGWMTHEPEIHDFQEESGCGCYARCNCGAQTLPDTPERVALFMLRHSGGGPRGFRAGWVRDPELRRRYR